MSAHSMTTARPVPTQGGRTGIVRILAAFMLVLLPWIAPAHAADATPAQASGQVITAQQAQQVLSVLNDPQKREEFTRTLDAIARGLPAQQIAPAPAPAPTAAKKPAATADVELEPDSISSETMNELTHMRDLALRQGENFMALFKDLAFVGRWVHSMLANTDSRQILLDALTRASLIFILALVAERGLSIAMRKPLAGVTARAVATEARLNRRIINEEHEDDQPAPPPASSADAAAEQQTEQARQQDDRHKHETLRIITRIPYSLLHLLIKLLPVGPVLCAGLPAVAVPADHHPAGQETVTITLTNAYVVARVVYLLLETLFVPRSPAIRLCSASERRRRVMVTRWLQFPGGGPLRRGLPVHAGWRVRHARARHGSDHPQPWCWSSMCLIAIFIMACAPPMCATALQPPARLRAAAFLDVCRAGWSTCGGCRPCSSTWRSGWSGPPRSVAAMRGSSARCHPDHGGRHPGRAPAVGRWRLQPAEQAFPCLARSHGNSAIPACRDGWTTITRSRAGHCPCC
ncbi:hypothetical protein ACOZ4Y_07055 [Komagataeibacter rhaeticus]